MSAVRRDFLSTSAKCLNSLCIVPHRSRRNVTHENASRSSCVTGPKLPSLVILGTLSRMGKKCLSCSRALPGEAAARLRYCNTKCRSRAYRERHRSLRGSANAAGARPTAALPQSPSFPNTPPAPRAPSPHLPPPPRRLGTSRGGSPGAKTRRPPVSDLLNAIRTELREALAGAEHRIVARAREAVAPVPLARQLLSQAPPQAAGYRLVLPPDSVGGKPRYAPRKTAAGTSPC